jgi:acylphosphatase
MSVITKRILVIGKVQGVGYRYSAKEKARVYGIKGWVKNLPDGNVLIEAEGSSTAMNQFINWCNMGPSMARIDSINVSEIQYQNHKEFIVTF